MKHASVLGLPVVLPSGIYHLPSRILFSIFVGLSKTTLQLSRSQQDRAWQARRCTRSQPISSRIGWPPSTTFIGRPRGVVYWVSMLIPMVLVMVAIRSMTPTGRSVMSTPSLSVAPTVFPPLDAAAANRDRPATWPVIAASVLVDPGGASELSHPDNQGAIEQPALGQVGHQRR